MLRTRREQELEHTGSWASLKSLDFISSFMRTHWKILKRVGRGRNRDQRGSCTWPRGTQWPLGLGKGGWNGEKLSVADSILMMVLVADTWHVGCERKRGLNDSRLGAP